MKTQRAASTLHEVALDRHQFAIRLGQLRERHAQTWDAAARFIEANGNPHDDPETPSGPGMRQYARWAGGHATPRPAMIDKIATAYGVDREFLLGPQPASGNSEAIGELATIARTTQSDLRVLRGEVDQHNDRLIALAAYLDAKLDLVLAHLGISTDGLPDMPAELDAALEQPEPRAAKSRRGRKATGERD